MFDTAPQGYNARPPAMDDAPAVAGLIAACQRHDLGQAEMTLEELLDEWKGLDLANEAVVVVAPNGRLAGYADLFNNRTIAVAIYGHVHPKERGWGIGAYLAHWGEAWTRQRLDQAPANARVVVRHYILASNAPARQLLEGLGYAAVRGVFWMAMALEQPPPAPEWPAGIRVRPFLPGQDEQATYEAYEDASRDMWSRPRSSFEHWLKFTQNANPEFLFVAEDGQSGAIAGVCATTLAAGRGHIGGLRVPRPWRRQGLGLALLHHAFGKFYRRGARQASLSVDADSPTNAPGLYLRAGLRVTRNYIVYQKELRPGEDLNAQ
ncbi:MAG: GNAT family N-acetyltransferase [Chloroflexi bacterium]|nr:GNAT family N-acetyltransferase [Chloroflexota bacterium]MCI0648260.1 GNAT family N-acetyltransferase [Chloroflexota bacterium]MCI0729852.1 GNAT family N-acetyltransferase [Chloroflexota bacterium]